MHHHRHDLASTGPTPGAESRRIATIDAEHDPRWAAYVDEHPDALVYQHPLWLRTLRAEYRQELIGLACVDHADRIVGVLPLVATRGLPLGLGGTSGTRRLSSLPRTPLAGPLANDRAAASDLVLAALALARERPGTHLQLKATGDLLPERIDSIVARPWRTSYALDLPPDPTTIRFGNAKRHGRITWAVNKAAKEGVEVRPPRSRDELGAWYRLYLDTMRGHAVPPRPRRLFEAAWDLLVPARKMTMLLAVRPGTPGGDLLAGSIFLHHGRTYFYAFNGRRADTLSLRPNDAILYHAIHHAAARGFARFDLGEVVRGGTGLAEFKSKWGATATTLRRYHHPDPGVDADAAPGEESDHAGSGDGGSVGLARRAWKRLPLPVTAVMGEGLYRFL